MTGDERVSRMLYIRDRVRDVFWSHVEEHGLTELEALSIARSVVRDFEPPDLDEEAVYLEEED